MSGAHSDRAPALTTGRVSRRLLVIRFIWTLIDGSAAFLLAIPQDWLLQLTAVVAAPLII